MGSGVVRRISIECVDVAVDEITQPWQPDTYYAEGAIVRTGGRNWARTAAGVSAESWAADFTDWDTGTFPPTLVQNWEMQADDQSPIGGPDRNAFLPTVRGAPVLLAAAMKGRAALADGMRVGELAITVPLDDAIEAGLWLGMRVRVEVPEGRLAIEGDSITGKVASYRMSSSAAEDICEVTVRFATGSGKSTAAPAGSNHGSLTGEPWDVVALPDLTGSAVRPMATGGIQRVRVINPVEDQIAYVEARDYSPGDGRTDPKATDPAALLGDVPTHFVIDLVPLAADDEILWEAEIGAGAVRRAEAGRSRGSVMTELTTGIRRAAVPERKPGRRPPSTAGRNGGEPHLQGQAPVAPAQGRAAAFPVAVQRHEDHGWHEVHAVEMRGYTETLVSVSLAPGETLLLDPTRAQVWRVSVSGSATIPVPVPEWPEPAVVRQDAPERCRTCSCVLVVEVASGGAFPTITGVAWAEGAATPDILLADGEEPDDWGGRYVFTLLHDPVVGDVLGFEGGSRF